MRHDHLRPVTINTPFIELDKLLKREDIAASGGEARYLISQGLALVNGSVETRKRRKLYPGDTITCCGATLEVVAAPPFPVDSSE
jgi:ribosome-associated protein